MKTLLLSIAAGLGVAAAEDFDSRALPHAPADRHAAISFAPRGGGVAAAEALARRHGLRLARVNRLGIADAHARPGRAQAAARRLALDPGVRWAEVVAPGRWLIFGADPPLPDDPRFADAWHLENTGQEGGLPGADLAARDAWRISTGEGDIVVALLDSGIELEHTDLWGAAWRNPGESLNGLDDDENGFIDDLWGWDFANDNNDPRPTDSSHGTRVAGVIAARTANGKGVAGIAGGWGGAGGVRVMALQIGEAGPYSEVLDDAVLYAIDAGAQIISLSLSVSPSQAIDAALAEARRAGVLLVAASGNTGHNVAYPATLDDAVAISGTTRGDTLWSSSARGPEIRLAAPAKDVWTTDIYGRYTSASGTSFAAPLAAGCAALVASASPFAPHRDALLLSLALGAVDLGAAGRDDHYGWGRIDARAAIGVRNELLGHVQGRVLLPRSDAALARGARVRAAAIAFDVLVDEAEGDYLLPLPEGAEQLVIAGAWGLAPDSAWVAVDAGGITTLDLAPRALAGGSVMGTCTTEEGVATGAALRVLPAQAHAPSKVDGLFQLDDLPGDSLVVLEARAVLRAAPPESLVIVAGDTLATELVLAPVQDFDQTSGGMTARGGVWAHGVGPDAHSAPALWGAPLGGGYPNQADASLIAPPLVVRGADARIAFHHQLATEEGYDGGNLKISTDAGQTWAVLEPSRGYSLPAFPGANQALSGEPGWSGRVDWRREVVALADYVGQQVLLRWHLGSDDSLAGEGWWIDDLALLGEVSPLIDIDLRPAALLGVRAGDPVQATVRVTNHSGEVQDVALRLVLDGAPVGRMPFGSLAPAETRELQIGRRLPALAPGTHGAALEIIAGGVALDGAGMLLEVLP